MVNQPPPSRRWTHFHSAIQLAIQRSAHKWTFEDFSECFSLYVEEAKDGARGVFQEISAHMEKQLTEDLDEIFKQYDVREKIDILHAVVTEAVARKESGDIGKDVWKEELHPRAAVSSRTIPLLEAQNQNLRRTLEELEEENLHLQSILEANVKACEDTDDKTAKLLDKLDKVFEEWMKLPMDEIQHWTVQTIESTKPTLRS